MAWKHCPTVLLELPLVGTATLATPALREREWYTASDMILISSREHDRLLRVQLLGGPSLSRPLELDIPQGGETAQYRVLPLYRVFCQTTMPPTKECEGCCVKMVQFIGTEHYSITRTCTDQLEINFFMVNHGCMTEGHRCYPGYWHCLIVLRSRVAEFLSSSIDKI